MPSIHVVGILFSLDHSWNIIVCACHLVQLLTCRWLLLFKVGHAVFQQNSCKRNLSVVKSVTFEQSD